MLYHLMSEIKMSSLGFFHALVLSSLFSYFQRMYEYPCPHNISAQEMPESIPSKQNYLVHIIVNQNKSYILFQTILTVWKSRSFFDRMFWSLMASSSSIWRIFVPTFAKAKNFTRIASLKLWPRVAFAILIPGIPDHLSGQRKKLVTSHQKERFSHC